MSGVQGCDVVNELFLLHVPIGIKFKIEVFVKRSSLRVASLDGDEVASVVAIGNVRSIRQEELLASAPIVVFPTIRKSRGVLLFADLAKEVVVALQLGARDQV